MEFTGCANDGAFGPAVHGCRGEFDFTIKFEKIFLSLLPSTALIALSAPRLITLLRRSAIVRGAWYQFLKLGIILTLAVIQIALIAVGSQAKRLASIFIASTVLEFLATLAMAALSYFEHSHAARPSLLLGIYLPLQVLFDATQIRSMWLVAHNHSDLVFVKLYTAGLALRVVITLLEAKRKVKWLTWDEKKHSPEEYSSIYTLATLSWIHSLLKAGYKKVLDPSDLLPLDTNLTVESLAKYADKIHPEKFKGKRHALAFAIGKEFAVMLLLCVAPRLVNLILLISQPLLIESLLKFLSVDHAPANVGYGLIGATILINMGPVIQSLDTYCMNRAMIAVRGTLVSKIYQQTTKTTSSASEDSAALTLMSADVEMVRMGLFYLHMFWSIPLQVGVSFWLLYRQLGGSFVAPVVVILVCLLISSLSTKFIAQIQTRWMEKTEVRVGKTTNVVGNMKNIKLSGLARPIQEAIQEMRRVEVNAGNRSRILEIFVWTFGFAPGQLAAMFTFIFTSKTLELPTIFASVAYIALLSNPISMLVARTPMFISGLACLQRIQDFLEKEPRKDFRTFQDESNSTRLDPSTIVELRRASIGWEQDKYVMEDISASMITGINMVIGPVACGKSTLCKALLGETLSFKGEIILRDDAKRIGFCDQVPVLLNLSIQDNILGYAPLDRSRYEEVLEAVSLKPDLATLDQGDQTIVGSHGISLSGGQKQRVSLARALYQDFPLYVFDDILSGLDLDTEQRVFECVFGSNGLLRKRGVAVVLCTHSVRHLPEADHIVALATDGTVAEQGTFDELMNNQSYVHSLGIKKRATDSGSAASGASQDTTEQESDLEKKSPAPATNPSAQEQERIARRTGDRQVFVHYCNSIGWFWVTMLCLSGVGVAFFWNFPNVWLKFWAASIEASPPYSHARFYYLGIYSLFCLLSLFVFMFEIAVGMVIVARLSGTSLHKAALNTLCSAPLSFFTRTDIGTLINLFSQDMALVDDELPANFGNAIACLAIGVGGCAVAAISSPYILIAYPFLGFIMYIVQRFYLRTSRQVRLIGLETKTPLYTNFIDTIKGLVTFRAFGWTPAAIERNNRFLDASQQPAYLQLNIQTWLTTTLYLLIGVIAILVVILATQLRNNPGFVGAGMVSIIMSSRFLGTFILDYTQLENSLGAVSRLKAFGEGTPSEHLPGEDVKPSLSWPEKGRLVLRNVSACYKEEQPNDEESPEDVQEEKSNPNLQGLALRDLNLTVESGQKVAICGRTGSGKSSLVNVLLRLITPTRSSNCILSIDGQQLDKVDRRVLRERIIAVPQEPVFLPNGASFMANLDLNHQATREECEVTLRAVDLWQYVEGKGGLDAGLIADEFSHGQKQLFSLGRAILRRRIRSLALSRDAGDLYMAEPTSEKTAAVSTVQGSDGGLLILDEYSSSLDVETDRAMQAIIHREFKDYTVIMVSHRLEMVMGFDKVVILDAGAVVEEGAPKVLAEEKDSRFRQLLLTGKTE